MAGYLQLVFIYSSVVHAILGVEVLVLLLLLLRVECVCWDTVVVVLFTHLLVR